MRPAGAAAGDLRAHRAGRIIAAMRTTLALRASAQPKRVAATTALQRAAAPARAGVPRYLQRAGEGPAADPAEHEARSVAADYARGDTMGGAQPAAAQAGALPGALRASMEQALGSDFGDVRVHADAAAGRNARALNARAFTVGNEIAFAPGAWQPDTPEGRELIAHELTHVAQQREAAGPGAGASGPRPVQRDEAAPTQPQPESIPDAASARTTWRPRVDALVRSRYGLSGDGVEASQVDVVDEAEFGRRFPASEMEEVLLNLFLSFGHDMGSTCYSILDYNRHPFAVAGVTSMRSIDELRRFVHEGIVRGHFEGQTREYEVRTGQRFPPFSITPGELIAGAVGGVTEVGPDRRSRRRITLQENAFVDTLVHEVCHFYVSNAFRNMARGRADGGEYLRGARIGQVLMEGFAEHFAQQVMDANAATLGPSSGLSYPDEVAVARTLVTTLGEATVRQAYFGGDAAAVALVAAAVDEYKVTPDELLVPRFIVEARIADARSAARPR